MKNKAVDSRLNEWQEFQLELLEKERKKAIKKETYLETKLYTFGLNKNPILIKENLCFNYNIQNDLKNHIKTMAYEYLLPTKLKSGEFLSVADFNNGKSIRYFRFKYKNEMIRQFRELEVKKEA